jgi:uncharacterized membrane protein SpoIIM required for sporulation
VGSCLIIRNNRFSKLKVESKRVKEITFINRNKDRWIKFENQLKKPSRVEPDELADQFIQLTDDLSYARTFYPRSQAMSYLNSLAMRTHQEIYRNKREKSKRFSTFFKVELPLILRQSRPYFLLSFIIFAASIVLGVVSALSDDGFIRLILSDHYVNMTIDNIEKGDPMAVYSNQSQLPMFLYITFNNIRVSVIAFVLGLLTPLGTIFVIFRNGIMVGAFQAFFYQKNLLGISTLAIMIHGTLELSAIVLAGGAGILLGKSLLFPGTYPRSFAFKKGARDGLKVILGLVPIFFAAGLLEGFVTRFYNQIPIVLNVLIIGLSLVIIIWYFFIYPEIVYQRLHKSMQHD